MLQTFLERAHRWPAPYRYLSAVALVAVAALTRWAFGSWLAPYNYFLFVIAVAICAIVFGRNASALATFLSAFIIPYYFVPPANSFALQSVDVVALLVFFVACFFLGLLGEVGWNTADRLRRIADEIRVSERQKDALYRELHHRTRNNLHLIASTIWAQMSRTSDPAVRDSLQAIGDRIMSIARVDDLLHRSAAAETVLASKYFRDLSGDIKTSLVALRPIDVFCEADAVPIDRELAEILGICANELITNALKYAFDAEHPGRVMIRFTAEGDALRLVVEDNGRGCVADARSGTGWKLVQSVLAKRQGRMRVESADPGCRVTLTVPAG